MKSRGLNTAPWWAPTLMLNSSLNWPFTCTQHLAFSYTALTAYVALAQLSYPSSIDHLLRLCAWSLSLFHLTWMRFSRSTHLLMFLSLETLMSIIVQDWLSYSGGTDQPGELCYLKWPYTDGQLSYSDFRLWFSSSFGFTSFFWC